MRIRLPWHTDDDRNPFVAASGSGRNRHRESLLHLVTDDERIVRIFDYIEAMVRAGRYLPPPSDLEEQVFDVFDWPEPATDRMQPMNGYDGCNT